MIAAAVLFDLDGTLIDTTDLILMSCAHTFERHLGSTPTRDALIATFGRSLPEALREFARDTGIRDPDTAADEMLATYRAHNDEHHDALIREFPGVSAMLDALQVAHRRLGVVTSKREGAARRGLDHYGLAHYFEVAVFHDDTERHKPDPEPLFAAVNRLGLDVGDVVYVGDSTHDVVAGRAAGIRTIAALWGPFARAISNASAPDALADTPRDVLRLLDVEERG